MEEEALYENPSNGNKQGKKNWKDEREISKKEERRWTWNFEDEGRTPAAQGCPGRKSIDREMSSQTGKRQVKVYVYECVCVCIQTHIHSCTYTHTRSNAKKQNKYGRKDETKTRDCRREKDSLFLFLSLWPRRASVENKKGRARYETRIQLSRSLVRSVQFYRTMHKGWH